MTTSTTRHRFTVSEYCRMAEAGILGEDDRVELIEGEIVDMAPTGIAHVASVNRLSYWLTQSLVDRAIVQVQSSLRLDEHSEPEPDVALLRFQPDFYGYDRPSLEDVLLVAEVSDTSFQYDCDVKVPLYARAGIPEFWLIDLGSQVIHVFRGPGSDGYQETFTVQKPDNLTLQAFPDVVLTVEQVLG